MLLVAPLDVFVAVFHRPSGITHLLTAPAPEILDVLRPGGATLAAAMQTLETRFGLADADPQALQARLDELVAAGLVYVA
ncbi:hypothetical protein ASE75_04980 [Sphingomonas sp. Leaf17]|nr:hypothetical protein ASE75_04980 [Sphingomonas sp. Leaf17]